MRKSEIKRKTSETDISLTLNIDGSGQPDIKSGAGFFDHMMALFATHGKFDIKIECAGDTYVDYHHTVEDIGIVLGKAFDQAIGDKRGITRYGNSFLPMDEALILSAVDISGRGMLVWDIRIPTEKVGDFDTELAKEFFEAFARNAGITLHIRQLSGENSHHIIEGAFKATARAVRQAVKINSEGADKIPSTKGVL